MLSFAIGISFIMPYFIRVITMADAGESNILNKIYLIIILFLTVFLLLYYFFGTRIEQSVNLFDQDLEKWCLVNPIKSKVITISNILLILTVVISVGIKFHKGANGKKS